MFRFTVVRRALAAVLIVAVAAPVTAQLPPRFFTNLKVLPKDVPPQELRALMGSFARALGVRCSHCHVVEEGKQPKPGDFALDDKPTKIKARAMMRMVQDLNDKYLAALETRADPPVRIECFTCHRGTTQPRTLQDMLKLAYDKGGMDSTLARYQSLHHRYYGRATYDFGELPLADVGGQLRDGGHPEDGARLLAFNVEMNPTSAFAKRQYAWTAIMQAYHIAGADSGAARYRDLKARYGEGIVSEAFATDVSYQLLHSNQVEPAIAFFQVIVADYPQSANAYDSLGEAYAEHGDKKLAIENYTKSLALDPSNTNAKQKIEELKHPSKAKPKPGK